jgi:predicted transcriptional regulator
MYRVLFEIGCTCKVINQILYTLLSYKLLIHILEDLKLRNRMDIIANILNSIRSNGDVGASKSHIVEIADVSYMKLREYAPLLDEYQLWKFDDETKLYTITTRGLEYLELYQLISELDEVIPRKAEVAMRYLTVD